MNLTIFQSQKGDCLLLTGSHDQGRVLIDGGMRPSYQTFVAPALGKLARANKAIDLVYLSHIDQDHIAGVLQLFNDAAEWKVHDFQRSHNNPTHPQPESPRPPAVSEVWHNAFHELVSDNAVPIGSALAASAAIFSGVDDDEWREIATEQTELATSIEEAIQLSRRLSSDQLSVPLNDHFGGKLAFVRTNLPPPQPIVIGNLEISVIGPFDQDLVILRKKWNKWLEDNQKTLTKLRQQAERDAERLGTADVPILLNNQIKLATQLGDRKKVTPPNLASLMLLVEEAGKTLLLTGDGHANDIIKGLQFHHKLDAQDCIHLNVLKVQHHGSENNMTEKFARTITADHYVFCGNGEHENPDLGVVELLLDARLGTGPNRSQNPLANGAFTFWFSSSDTATKNPAAKQHMIKLQALMANRVATGGGRLETNFLSGNQPSFDLII